MSLAKPIYMEYVESNSIEIQGKASQTMRYLKKGYQIKISRNGYWLLTRPARVFITLSDGEREETFNMKEDICELYNRTRISKKLCQKFEQDCKSGKVKFDLDSYGHYTIM